MPSPFVVLGISVLRSVSNVLIYHERLFSATVPPALTVTPTNLTMAEGHNATLRCSAAGNPTPTITWMKDGQTVATGRSLTLGVKKEDSGIYWCIADNGLRVTANASAFLNVQCE